MQPMASVEPLATMRREQVGTFSSSPYVPRRRPGPSAGASVIGRGVSLPRPSRLGPGLRRGTPHARRDGSPSSVLEAHQCPTALPHSNLLRCACDDAPGTGRYGFFEPVRSPAKAGAQCRSIRNRARRFVTTAPATGPRPSPGNIACMHAGTDRRRAFWKRIIPQQRSVTPSLLRCACEDAPGTARYILSGPVRSPAKAGAQ